MKTKVKKKKNTLVITCFVVGLIVYLIGLLLLFSSSISNAGGYTSRRSG